MNKHRDLELRDPRAEVRDDVFARDLADKLGLGDDDGRGFLAENAVRYADDGAVKDGGVREDSVFDFLACWSEEARKRDETS